MQHVTLRMKTKALVPAGISLLALVGAVFAYYCYTWGSIQNFVDTIDPCNLLFCDFKRFYWTTGQAYFSSPIPTPGFFYSAFAGLLFVPFGFLSEETASELWGGLQILLVVPLCLISPGSSFRIFYTFLVITSYPLLQDFKWGQISLLLNVCILSSLFLYRQGRRYSAVWVLAIAAAIKYYPAIFVIYFIAKRDWRSTSMFFLAFFVLFYVLPVVLLGSPHWLSFQQYTLTNAMHNPGHGLGSQYIGNVLARLSPALDDNTYQDILRAAGIFLTGFNIALVLFLQKLNTRHTDALMVSLVCVSLPFLLRTAWPHYFTYLPFCQMTIFAEVYAWHTLKLRWKIAFFIGVFASMALSSIFVFNGFSDWGAYEAVGTLFWSNSIVLIMIYGIMILSPEHRETAQIPR